MGPLVGFGHDVGQQNQDLNQDRHVEVRNPIPVIQ